MFKNKNISIIFDLDGTLVHSSPSLTRAANKLLKEINREIVDQKTYESFIGKGIPNQIKCLLEFSGGIPHDGLKKYIDRFREIYDEDPFSASSCYNGVKDCLILLKNSGFNLAICTQKNSHPAKKLLSHLGLESFFNGYAFGDSLDVMKPNPKMVDLALKNFDTGPVFYIGDSETDSQTAKNSNACFFLFTGGYRKKTVEELAPDESFDNHKQIFDLIQNRLKKN